MQRRRSLGLCLVPSVLFATFSINVAHAAPIIETYAGNGVAGQGTENVDPLESALYFPMDVTVAPNGDVYVMDWNNHRIRVVEDGLIRTAIGSGTLSDSSGYVDHMNYADQVNLNHPTDITFDPQGDIIVSAWHNSKILHMDIDTKWVQPIVAADGFRSFGGDGGQAIDASLDLPSSTVFNAQGVMLISDQENQRIRSVSTDGIINTVVGTGVAGFCGDGGPAIEACLNNPRGQAAFPGGKIAIDGDGNLFIADTNNHRIRKVTPDGTITTVAGNGSPGYSGDGGEATLAQLRFPSDVAIGLDGSHMRAQPAYVLYIADTFNHCIRMVDSGVISTVAGIGGESGFLGDGGDPTAAKLNRPSGITVDDTGRLFIADTGNNRIRVVQAAAATVAARVDIRPGSCPNPLNVNPHQGAGEGNDHKGGVLPVALLGGEGFDAAAVDVASLRLEGVAPISSHGGPVVEDNVVAPSEGSDCTCSEDGADGYPDLNLKFSVTALQATLSPGDRGEERSFHLTGQMQDGTPFETADCVVLVGNPNPGSHDTGFDAKLIGRSGTVSGTTARISYHLPEQRSVRLTVHDIQGRLIKVLVSELRGPGDHTVEWNVGDLSNGVYFYRFVAGEQIDTQRIVRLR